MNTIRTLLLAAALLTWSSPPLLYASSRASKAALDTHITLHNHVYHHRGDAAFIRQNSLFLCISGGILMVLATWSGLSLIIRRLRETRPGLYGLPLCAAAALLDANDRLTSIALCYPGAITEEQEFPLILRLALLGFPLVLYCLPGKARAEEAPCQG